MEQKKRVIYDSITGMTKEELTRFLAMVAPTIACRACPYWDANEEKCFADRDFFCTNDYAESLIAKYLDCPVDDVVDTVKVVRCKDCAKWKPYRNTAGAGYCHNKNFCFTYGTNLDREFTPITMPGDFCSNGERRDDNA